jgi:hypothetical protein
MKIIKQTPTKLVLLYFPLGIWFLVLGFIILPFGLVLNLHKATDRFTCHRIAPSQGTCTLRKLRFWLGSPIEEEILLSKLQKVQVSKITGGRNHFEYIVFVDKQGCVLSMGSGRQYGTNLELFASQINAFLNNPAESLLVVEEQPPLGLLRIDIFFIIIGFCLLAIFARIVFYTFDLNKNCININRIGLLRIQSVRYPLDQISDVKAEATANPPQFYKLSLILADEQRIFINPGDLSQLDSQRIVELLQNFLNLPKS